MSLISSEIINLILFIINFIILLVQQKPLWAKSNWMKS